MAIPALASTFSPDGQSVAFWADDQLKRISLRGGAAVPICRISYVPTSVDWGDRGILFTTTAGFDGVVSNNSADTCRHVRSLLR